MDFFRDIILIMTSKRKAYCIYFDDFACNCIYLKTFCFLQSRKEAKCIPDDIIYI